MMSELFNNAVDSIVLGLEDYQTNEPQRALSAVRNLYAGVLLLGKEVLVRQVPNAKPEVLLAARVKPMPDGCGGITYVAVGCSTVDFTTLGRRLKDFKVNVDLKDMERLSEIRNDIEHRSSDQPPEAIREHVAAVFPTVVQLFRHAGEEPGDVLGETWHVILEVRGIYEAEAKACQGTVEAVKWAKSIMSELALRCPNCNSMLVEQLDTANDDPLSMRCSCRACVSELDPEEVIEATLGRHFAVEAYIAVKDGGEEPLGMCPECGRDTYIWGSEDDGCAVCGAVLGRCFLCEEPLSPWSVSSDDESWCSYCHYKMHKDD